jgi:ankyrin repeat domain-containing protein 13
MVFKKQFPELLKVFKSGQLQLEQINEKDHRGNTPLLLAGKKAIDDEDYLKCVNFLFKNSANGKLRDANGWSLMDEAIGQGNSRLMAISFDWLNIYKKEKIDKNKKKVKDRLKNIPDFYTEINWDCSSSWIPFLSKIAPSDTFQIWKIDNFIRLDFSLVGF